MEQNAWDIEAMRNGFAAKQKSRDPIGKKQRKQRRGYRKIEEQGHCRRKQKRKYCKVETRETTNKSKI
jgi:hypothetical protein